MTDVSPLNLFHPVFNPLLALERLAAVLIGSGISLLEAFRAAYPQHEEAFEAAETLLTDVRDGLEALSAKEQIPPVRRLALMGVKAALNAWLEAHGHKDGLRPLTALVQGGANEVGRLLEPPEVQTIEAVEAPDVTRSLEPASKSSLCDS